MNSYLWHIKNNLKRALLSDCLPVLKWAFLYVAMIMFGVGVGYITVYYSAWVGSGILIVGVSLYLLLFFSWWDYKKSREEW